MFLRLFSSASPAWAIQNHIRTVLGPRSEAGKKSALVVTQSAKERIQYLLSQMPGTSALRLGVKSRGCSGMSYTIDYQTDPPGKFDEVVSLGDGNEKIIVDPRALLHVIGTTMDFVDTKLSSEFVFINPNATGICGCGESFTTNSTDQPNPN